MIFHTTNFKAASPTQVINPLDRVQSMANSSHNLFAFSTLSIFRIPKEWRQSIDAIMLYSISGRIAGQMPVKGLDHIDGKRVGELFGPGTYLVKAKGSL
jgi:hypothetical protein